MAGEGIYFCVEEICLKKTMKDYECSPESVIIKEKISGSEHVDIAMFPDAPTLRGTKHV